MTGSKAGAKSSARTPRVYSLEPGEYGKINGVWYACSPNGHTCNLKSHTVTEHDDGTITVSPSIGIRYTDQKGWLYHGWLKRGIWTEA